MNDSHNSKISYALDHAKRGFSVLPLQFITANGRCSCGSPEGKCKPGKHPLTKHGFKDATSDASIITKMWSKYPQANIGIALDKLVALDVDYRHGGQKSLHTLEAKYGPFPRTVKQWTGSGDGSHHIIMLAPNSGVELQNMGKVDGLPGLELKVKGYIVAVGSITQQPYVWQPGASPDEIAIAPMPEWLVDLSRQPFKEDNTAGPDKQKWEYRELSDSENERALAKVLDSCMFLQHCAKDAVTLSEPEWQAMIELLVFFGEAGQHKIHQLSQPYPTYSDSETNKKIANAIKAIGKKHLGPYTCKKIEQSLGFQCPPDCLARRSTTRTPVTTAIKVVMKREEPPIQDVPADDISEPGQNAKVLHFHHTDIGNAERLVWRYGSILHYCEERKLWLIWNGKVWAWDSGVKVKALAKRVIRGFYEEAATETDEDKRKALADHARKSEAEPRLNAMVSLAQMENGILVKAAQLDTTPWLLNCLNGTLDLRTGTLHPHTKEDLLTILIPVDYNPTAQCPMWDRFLNRIMGEDSKMIGYLQRAVGYSLTGSVREQVLFFLWGQGENGKTTFLNVIQKLCGDYSERVPMETFVLKRKGGSGPSEGLANLKGKRFVVSSETSEGRRLNESMIKDAVGGDPISADRKYEHFIKYSPTFKLWIFGNHKPIIRDTTLGMWRKVKLIPFAVTIPEAERDKDLADRLEAELPGILAWAVRGFLDYQNGDGLGEPGAVTEATSDYQKEQDEIAPFIEDCCALGPNEDCTTKELYEAYKAYCQTNGEYTIGKREFGRRIAEKGIDRARGTGNVQIWVGISLKSPG